MVLWMWICEILVQENIYVSQYCQDTGTYFIPYQLD